MKLLALIFALAVLLSFPEDSLSASTCGTADFKEFTLFPNPVQVGQTAHIRAVASLSSLPATISGSIMVTVKFNGELDFQIFNISLCDSTSSIVCSSLGEGDNVFNFDFYVPNIPIGTYDISVETDIDSWGSICESFSVAVVNPSYSSDSYVSSITATLAGTAQFSNPNVLNRAAGDMIQVGPIGSAPSVYSSAYQWGQFLSISGSEDLVVPRLSTSGYVWGMSGTITDIEYHSTVTNHTYQGQFYVGYVSDLSKTALDVSILEGSFTVVFSYTTSGSSTSNILLSSLQGEIIFLHDYGSLPTGWSNPVLVEKFPNLVVSTSSEGLLMVQGSKTYCWSASGCADTNNNQTAAIQGGSSSGLTDGLKGLVAALVVGVPLIGALLVALILWRRHRKRYEEEDGIFAAARKPEYGNALVVDDIIQETREHGGSPMIPTLDRHPGDSDSDSASYSEDESELSNHRQSRFSREVGSPSNRREVGSPSNSNRRRRSPSADSRGRRSRSNSVDPRRRSRRSVSRSRSVERDDGSESYYSDDDAGSSASRASLSDD